MKHEHRVYTFELGFQLNFLAQFWEAADNQTFPPETIAIVMHVSLPWLQKKRCEGGGIPFSKPHKRQVNYVKADVLAYIEQNKMAHTA
ncbi:DNA-binding protein [Acinetobacter baumannii]|uniref:DNA-binding protein n=1 Tax=Acinetobacter baumannii TaxID=470 RepID=UPI00299C7674|nr:DNA-binding protein [Acinetobacter baumannii]HAV5004281.1 DNA-binding protein [Acinetobacter baumannii]HAV5007890.1 DNA-binding protein [Acinetobacter baumannii]